MVSDKVILGEKDKACIFFLEEGEMAPNGNFFKKNYRVQRSERYIRDEQAEPIQARSANRINNIILIIVEQSVDGVSIL